MQPRVRLENRSRRGVAGACGLQSKLMHVVWKTGLCDLGNMPALANYGSALWFGTLGWMARLPGEPFRDLAFPKVVVLIRVFIQDDGRGVKDHVVGF